MTPDGGIKIGVRVIKGKQNVSANGNESTNGFIDKDAHRAFVENVFTTSPYKSQVGNKPVENKPVENKPVENEPVENEPPVE